jgi:hypothetical protein
MKIFLTFILITVMNNSFSQDQVEDYANVTNIDPIETEKSTILLVPKAETIPELVAPTIKAKKKSARWRYATDVIAFPNTGELAVGLDIYSRFTSYKVKTLIAQAEVAETEIQNSGLNFQIYYAFNNYIAAGVSVEDGTSKRTVKYGVGSTESGKVVEYNSSGSSDPNLYLIYHLSDSARNKFDINLELEYSPMLGESVDSTLEDDGNHKKGGDTAGVSFIFGKNKQTFSWGVGVSYFYVGAAESRTEKSDEVTRVESFGVVGVEGRFQWGLGHHLSIDLNVGVGYAGEYYVISSEGNISTYDSRSLFSLSTGMNFKMVNNILLTVKLKSTGTSSTMVSRGTNSDLTIDDRTSGTLEVGIIKQF